jgi:cytochrome b
MQTAAERSAEKVRAWDLPTRIFHWLLLFVILSAWVSYEFSEAIGDNTMKWHRYNGYAAMVLIVWRLLWGVVGSSTSRFSSFVTWPWNAARYGADLVRGRDRHYLGHNPLGTYMVLALLGLVFVQTMLGMLATEHNFLTWGPLAPLISEEATKFATHWHQEVFDVLKILIFVHIIANVLYAVVKREPLIRAMVTGTKPAVEYVDTREAEIGGAPLLRAFVCLLVASGIVLGGILALGGKLFY